jgi:predicted RNase H-like nuclease (RuvC/YqgF family)
MKDFKDKLMEMYEESIEDRKGLVEKYIKESKTTYMYYQTREKSLVNDLADQVIRNMDLERHNNALKKMVLSLQEEVASIRTSAVSEVEKRTKLETTINLAVKQIERYV